MTGSATSKLEGFSSRLVEVLLFVVAPILAGLVTLLTGSLTPISTLSVVYLVLTFAALPRLGGRLHLVPRGRPMHLGSVNRWWSIRRRWGFYASFSMLTMVVFAFLRSAITNTWGGGDILLALLCLIPLFVILRKPPHIVDGTAT
jgi:hypothetical protein